MGSQATDIKHIVIIIAAVELWDLISGAGRQ
jgi:hypothetical protein